MRTHLSTGELRGQRMQDLLLKPWVWIAAAILIGLAIAGQYTVVNIRLIKLLVGVAFVVVVVRFPTYVSLGVFFILYTTPTAIFLGNTNFLFITVMAIAWLVKFAMRIEPGPRRTALDWAILAYVIVHLISCANIRTVEQLTGTLDKLRHLIWPIILYYLIVFLGRSRQKLMFLAQMLTASMLWVCFTGFMERFFPGVHYLPDWYLSVLWAQGLFAENVVRVGGIFRAHALLSDSAAVVAIMQAYLALHFRHRPWLRAYHWFVLVVCVYTISLSGNRGGLILLLFGGLYFLVVFAREISWKRAFVALLVLAVILQFGEMTLAGFEGDPTLLVRMVETRVDRGVPDTRKLVWSYVWDRIQERPIIGHGPYYNILEERLGGRGMWPHNAYLFYVFTIGFLGLPTFLFLCWKVIKRTYSGWRLRVGEISFARGMAAVFHVGILQFLLGQMRTDHQRADVFVYFMWILFGLGVLARDLADRDERERPAIEIQTPMVTPSVLPLESQSREVSR